MSFTISDLEECFISSRVEILKDAQPFLLATESTNPSLNDDQCKNACLNDPKCFAFTKEPGSDCTLGRYKKESSYYLISRGIPDILEHKGMYNNMYTKNDLEIKGCLTRTRTPPPHPLSRVSSPLLNPIASFLF